MHSVQVNIPSTSGDMGVLANHVPSIEQLKAGVLEIFTEGGNKEDYFVAGGFAIVQPGSKLSINAVEAYKLEDFSKEVSSCKEGANDRLFRHKCKRPRELRLVVDQKRTLQKHAFRLR